MSRLVGQKNTESLLNSYDYNSLSSLRRLIKQLLRLNQRAIKGNEAAIILITDIKSGLGFYKSQPSVLTPRQLEVLNLCLIEDLTEYEAAEILQVSQQNIHIVLQSGIKRLRKYLLRQPIAEPKFSTEEVSEIILRYQRGEKPKQIAEALGKELRIVQNKIKTLKLKGRLGTRGERNESDI